MFFGAPFEPAWWFSADGVTVYKEAALLPDYAGPQPHENALVNASLLSRAWLGDDAAADAPTPTRHSCCASAARSSDCCPNRRASNTPSTLRWPLRLDARADPYSAARKAPSASMAALTLGGCNVRLSVTA